MRLEPELWAALEEMCRREGLSMKQMMQRLDAGVPPGGRTSAVRVRVLAYFAEAATEEGHRRAGHGCDSCPPHEQANDDAVPAVHSPSDKTPAGMVRRGWPPDVSKSSAAARSFG